MNRYLKISILHFALALFIVILFCFLGCASNNLIALEDFNYAENLAWKAFKTFENENQDFEKIIHVKDLTIVISGKQDNVAKKLGAIGYASKDKIWIRGIILNGKIFLFYPGLGHEMGHILNFYDNDVINPDKILK